MSIIILDSCSYTRTGLSCHMASKGIKKKCIFFVNEIGQIDIKCQQEKPDVIFINEECFIHEAETRKHIREIIFQYPETLFFIFMSISNIRFEEYIYVRKNLIITSKSLKISTLNSLLANYLKKKKNTIARLSFGLDINPLSLSQTESNMLKMWMSGQNTIQISDNMNIKTKTVSSHKGNIKRKIKTHNKQVIYHVVRLTDNITSGIYVNVK